MTAPKRHMTTQERKVTMTQHCANNPFGSMTTGDRARVQITSFVVLAF